MCPYLKLVVIGLSLPEPKPLTYNEIELIKSAIAISEAGIEASLRAGREGASLEDICSVFIKTLAEHGAKALKMGGPFIVKEWGNGPKRAVRGKWETPPTTFLQKGDLWGVDFTAQYMGYHTDIGRYGFIGTPTREVLEGYDRVVRAQSSIAGLIKPSMLVSDVYNSIPKEMPFEVHGIDLAVPEEPMFGTATAMVERETEKMIAKKVKFKPNTVICIEIWAGLLGGIEDMYIITAEGAKRLTTLPQRIFTQQG